MFVRPMSESDRWLQEVISAERGNTSYKGGGCPKFFLRICIFVYHLYIEYNLYKSNFCLPEIESLSFPEK